MNILKKFSLVIASLSLVSVFHGCSSKEEATNVEAPIPVTVSDEPTKGYIWEASKDGKVIHLIGTKHPAPENVNYFNDTLNKIIDDADILGVELDITDSTLLKEAQTLLNKQYISTNGSVKERLSDEEFEKFKVIIDDLGINYGQVKNFSDLGLISVISSTTIQKLGYIGTTLDQALIKKFKDSNRAVVSLETPEIQANALNASQSTIDFGEYLLEYDSATYLKNESETANDGYYAYAKSDKVYPENLIKIERDKLENKGKAHIYDDITHSRNSGMVEKINQYIKEDKKYVIAIGYMHYFGENSILNLLEKEGYTIKDLVL